MYRGYRVVVGMATMPEREGFCAAARRSLDAQSLPYDAFYLYDNGKQNYNATDNGKFYGLTIEKEPCFYLTTDDDIIYPFDYIQKMVDGCIEHGGIVTIHGRKLNGDMTGYYKSGHSFFHCINKQDEVELIDVPGSGVSCFHTSYCNPAYIFTDERQCMTDLLLGEYAAIHDIPIWCLERPSNYVTAQWVNPKRTIYGQHANNDRVQTLIAQKIKHEITCRQRNEESAESGL